MGTYFELGKAKAAKGEGWALPFISCQRYSGTSTPIALTATRLQETFTFLSCARHSLFFKLYLSVKFRRIFAFVVFELFVRHNGQMFLRGHKTV